MISPNSVEKKTLNYRATGLSFTENTWYKNDSIILWAAVCHSRRCAYAGFPCFGIHLQLAVWHVCQSNTSLGFRESRRTLLDHTGPIKCHRTRIWSSLERQTLFLEWLMARCKPRSSRLPATISSLSASAGSVMMMTVLFALTSKWLSASTH